MSGVELLIDPLRVLNEAAVEAIHEATLGVLTRTGVRFEHRRALDILAGHGARVEGNVAKLPADLVERALRTCPRQVTFAARNPRRNVDLGLGRVHYTSGFGATFVRDLETGEVRDARLDDVRDFTRLADFCDNVHYCLMPVVPQDTPGSLGYLRAAALMLQNTDKHVALGVPTEELLEELMVLGEIATQASGSSAPVFSLGHTSSSPLTFSHDAVEKLLCSVERGIPFRLASGAMAGATAPATLAGTLVVQNAEMLAGIALGQLFRPGAVVTYGTFAGPMDMSAGKLAMGSPELALVSAATNQLCRRYGIPLAYGTGGVSESAIGDLQAGLEKAATVFFTALAGVEVIHDAVSGLLGSAMLVSYEQMVTDDELVRMVNRALRGIAVDGDTLATEVIAEVGPGGAYLSHDHTLRHFRREQFLPGLLVRWGVSEWMEGRRATVADRARHRAREILASHRPSPLPEEALREMASLLGKLASR